MTIKITISGTQQTVDTLSQLSECKVLKVHPAEEGLFSRLIDLEIYELSELIEHIFTKLEE